MQFGTKFREKDHRCDITVLFNRIKKKSPFLTLIKQNDFPNQFEGE